VKPKARRRVARHASRLRLLAYAQDFLGPAERAKTEAHLKSCADCRKQLLSVRRFLRALQKALTPKEISSKELLARVKREMAKRKRLARKS
jgi:hypothetical protein